MMCDNYRENRHVRIILVLIHHKVFMLQKCLRGSFVRLAVREEFALVL